MMKARALGILGALLAAGRLSAGLANPVLDGPTNVSSSQVFTLTLQVDNSGPGNVDNVGVSLTVQGSGFSPAWSSGPSPASYAQVTPTGRVYFTWLYSGTGCGSATFSAYASGMASGTPVASANAGHQVTLYCTPTPTPTATPNYTATPTPWVIYATATPVPPGGWAGIPGNLYHPLLGQPLQLKAALPEAARLSIEIYDRLGHKVKSLAVDGGPGMVTVPWDGRSDEGLWVATGIYAAQFKARGFSRVVKFAVIK